MTKDPTLEIKWIRAYSSSRSDPEDYIEEVTNEDVDGFSVIGAGDESTYAISSEIVDIHSPSKIITHGSVLSVNELAAKGRLEREVSISSLDSSSGMAQRKDVKIISKGERSGLVFDKKRIEAMLEGTQVEEMAALKEYKFYIIQSLVR